MIDIKNITLQIGGKELLRDASLAILAGQKVGIVGANGAGKSTLFKAITGQVDILGEIQIPQENRLAFVEQTIENDDLSIFDYVVQKDKYLNQAKKAYEMAPFIDKAEAYEELKRLGYETQNARVESVLKGLGFKAADFSRPVSDFSGGWQMRLNLAGALVQPADILLLDEPTNHLDLESVLWLGAYLKKYTGTLLLISHDRHILNEICDKIVVFNDKKLFAYQGNYDGYLKIKALEEKVQARQIQKDKEKRAHLEAFINRFRYKASKAKQAQSRIKMLEKMSLTPALCLEKEEHFSFLEPAQALPPLILCELLQLGYDTHVVLESVSFSIGENERIALLGRNGNGKSTLAKFMAGKLTPQKGSVHLSPKLEVGYFSQHQEEELPLNETPVSYFETLMKGATQTVVRSHLARFLLTGDKALTEIKKLSGGEKSRLLLAKIALSKPNLLILDEPTNHLDMKGRKALAGALNAYEGAIILITHDFDLIQEVADTLWLVDKKRVAPFAGDLEDYKAYLLTVDVDKNKAKALLKEREEKARQKEEKKQNQAEKRKLKADILALERKMNTLNQDKAGLEKLFESPLTSAEILEVTKKITSLQKEIDVLEEKWFSLSEMLEE